MSTKEKFSFIREVEKKLERASAKLEKVSRPRVLGRVEDISSVYVVCSIPDANVGDFVKIKTRDGREIGGEVVGFRDGKAIVIPYEGVGGLAPGVEVERAIPKNTQKVGFGLLGRVVDGLGEPIDGKGPISWEDELPLFPDPANPLEREMIREPLDVGVRSINALLTVGKGQRVGIFGGSGVGKSSLLGMMARHTKADVNVIALIGERGREVKEFIFKVLGEEGLKRSVVVVSTSDTPPLLKVRAAYLAHTYAEFFARQGMSVLLVMDSVTRFAMAMREIGISVGEPPTARGYTPSVFTALPRLLERAGNFSFGSITAFYTVLVEGDDTNEPISDNIRAIIDGHIVLSRSFFNRKVMPSVDPLSSISRVMPDIVTEEHFELALKFSSALHDYLEAEDMITIGAYKGGNPRLDWAIKKSRQIFGFLTQKITESADFESSLQMLRQILSDMPE